MSSVERVRAGVARNPLFLGLAIVLLALAGAFLVTTIGADSPAQVGDGGAEAGAATADTGSLSASDASISGLAANDTAGASVAWAGDVDGDGQRDLLVGAPGADVGGEDAGAVALFYGPVDANATLADANVTFVGEAPGDEAGHAVAGAGDLDGDGADEVLVGAPRHGESDRGAAYVLTGEEIADGEQSLGDAALALEGAPGARAGWSVAAAGSAGDTRSVLVGAPRGDSGARDDAGAAYLVTNETIDSAATTAEASEGGNVTLADVADATMVGEATGDQAGWAVAGAGDVDDDGTDDVLVGARNTNVSEDGQNAGGAYLVSGPVEGTLNLSAATARLGGAQPNAQAGYAVAGGTDLNGDDVDDVVVGAPFANASDDVPDAGAAYVLFGGANYSGNHSLSAANVTLAGNATGDRAGWSLATGRATCDGSGDLVVGAPRAEVGAEDAGTAYTVTGGDLPASATLSAANRTVVGGNAGAQAGRSVATLSGMNGSDANDSRAVAVGAPFADADAGQNAGTVAVHYADCTATEPESGNDSEGLEAGAEATESPTATPADEESGLAGSSGGTSGGFGGSSSSGGSGGGAASSPETATATPTNSSNSSTGSPTNASNATETEPGTATPTPTATATPNGTPTATPTETATATPTETATETDTSDFASIEADITCERSTPFLYNDNDESVTVTVDGPNGETTYEVGPGIDIGGPSAPSLNGESLPGGEYTVTAEGPDGSPVPVNGESAWTTTVRDCPTTTLQTQCVDGDTVQVSLRAENLDGRFSNPVAVEVQSPDPDDRQTFSVEPDGSGVAASEFGLSDSARATIWVDLTDYQPSQLASVTVEAGACDDVAEASDADDGEQDETSGQSEASGQSDGSADQAEATETATEPAADDTSASQESDESAAAQATETDEPETATSAAETTADTSASTDDDEEEADPGSPPGNGQSDQSGPPSGQGGTAATGNGSA